ncbi:hypothetical protein ABZ352_19045 [Streptomyces griseofuscus]|uniref:hypothetical protein n=1 Tax=Streptomyces griseofuscus TaxID=146922 RepID=UPI0033D1A43B
MNEHLKGWAERQPATAGVAAGTEVPTDSDAEPAITIEPVTEAHAELHGHIVKLHAFVKARSEEAANVSPAFWTSLGHTLGSAEAYLDCGDIVGAVRQAAWYRKVAARWSDHPDFPAEAAQ